MSLLLSLPIVLTLAATPSASPDTLLGPVHTAEAGEGPAVVFRQQRAGALVALRLSVRVEESPGLEGGASLLQDLARDRLESTAARYGARAELRRTPTHLIYTITGSATDFGALARALQRAIEEPRRSGADLNPVWALVRERWLEEVETPAALIRLRLRQRLFPDVPPSPGESPSARSPLTPDALEALWSQLFQPDRMHLVIVGDLGADEALAAFHGWKAPKRRRWKAANIPSEPGPDPQVHFPWAGLGYPADDGDAAALTVAAALIERRLAVGGMPSGRSELWWSPERRALVLFGSARPDTGGENGNGSSDELKSSAAVQQRLERTVSEAGTLSTQAEVAVARRTIRRDLLGAARTPAGLATLIGEFYDRTGEPESASDFLAALDTLSLADVRRALRSLPEEPLVKVEVSR